MQIIRNSKEVSDSKIANSKAREEAKQCPECGNDIYFLPETIYYYKWFKRYAKYRIECNCGCKWETCSWRVYG